MGQFAEAEKVIDEGRRLERLLWADAIKVYILLHTGRAQEALELINEVVEAAPKHLWYRSLHALCCRMLSDQSFADEDYRWILERYDPSDVNNLNDYAWAAFSLGEIDKALEIYRPMLEDPAQEICSVYWNLGLCYLAKGDLVAGKENIEQGIKLAVNSRQIDDLAFLELEDVERLTANEPDKIRVQIRTILDQVKEEIKIRRTQLTQKLSVEGELKQIIAKLTLQGETNDWPWIASHAGQARFYTENERWSEAAKIYQLLQEQAERFPEARLGLGKVFDALEAEGDRLLKEGNTELALEQYVQLLTFMLADDKTRQVRLHSRLGYAYFDLANIESARIHFAKAIQLSYESNIPNPGEALGELCRSFLRDDTHYWALENEWKILTDEPGADEGLRNDFAGARKSLAIYLAELFQLSEKYVDNNDLTPIAKPVVLEIGKGLIPSDTSNEWSLFKYYIPEMRDRIKDTMGVTVPGVWVRANEDLPSDGYSIKLNENPIAQSDVQLDSRYCPNPPEVLHKIGIPGGAIVQAPHPLTSEPGCWIKPLYWQHVVAAGMELWAEPLVFIVYHLEAVLRRNLTLFVGVQEVESLIGQWEHNDEDLPLINKVLPDSSARLRLKRVLGALVKEHVPITSWQEILAALQDGRLTGDDIKRAVRYVRLRLKKQLPGNNLDAKHLKLPQELEDKLMQWTRYEHGHIFFSAQPEETKVFLSAIRTVVGTPNRKLVMIVREPILRSFVRQLIAYEFPDLMVLSQEEMLTRDEMMADAGEGDMEQSKGVASDG